jgi:hypothetical protein
MAADELTPRARVLLEAVEREVRARAEGLGTAPAEPVRPLRLDETLLAALEQAVGGATRAETAERLDLPVVHDALDAVYGDGSPPDARLSG